MSALTEYCETFNLCPIKTMNLLQEWGVVADECITTDDVAPVNCELAIKFSRLNNQDLRPDPRD